MENCEVIAPPEPKKVMESAAKAVRHRHTLTDTVTDTEGILSSLWTMLCFGQWHLQLAFNLSSMRLQGGPQTAV